MTVIMQLGVPNKNGRIYSAETMKKAIDGYKDKPCCGTVGTFEQGIDRISHVFENLRIEDGYLVGDLTVLDTGPGKILTSLLQTTEVAYRTAGTGELRETEEGMEVIDYTLESITAMLAQEAA